MLAAGTSSSRVRWLGLAVVVACSSAPAPERSSHPDSTDGERRDGAATASAADAGSPPAPVPDVSAAELESLRTRLGCAREGPPQPGSTNLACGLIGLFARGTAPTLSAGVLPGVVVQPGEGGRDIAQPALLAVRGSGAAARVAWGRILPHDPLEAADLAEMAAAILGGQAPTLSPAPWPGLSWQPLRPTSGNSVQVGDGPRAVARASDGATVVLVLDGDDTFVALHRAP